jgi:hypothetical protein
MYDSRIDTLIHIQTVARYLHQVVEDLLARAEHHDASKLQTPEKEAFDIATPKLHGLTYGSEEYRAALREMKPAIEHHYSLNPHHPEFYGHDGIDGMSLVDLIEMLCDWKAATERHDDGDIKASLEHNEERFKIGGQLGMILRNTVDRFGW